MNDYTITLRDTAKPSDLMPLCERFAPIVRCKGCHYYSDDVTHDGNHWCRFMAQYVTAHGFCAWGIKGGNDER